MLITGVSGLLGNNLAYYFRNKYDLLGVYYSHPVTLEGVDTIQCDLTDPDATHELISTVNPNILIHCASLANIEQCESNHSLAEELNVGTTRNLVKSLGNQRTQLIYISSDSVYDGIQGNFVEESEKLPQNYYGQTKLDGEYEALKAKNSLVLRTNIFGWNVQEKKSLGEWILEELQQNRKINGFEDAYFSSIYTFELARVIDIALQKKITGVYNCGSSDACSKYEFACKIAERFGLDKQEIRPISIDEFHLKAKRGKSLSLNVQKLQQSLGYFLPTLDYSIERFYRDFQSEIPQEIKRHQSNESAISKKISYGRQWIGDDDIKAVVNTLRSERITQGPQVEQFERALASYCGAEYGVAVNSGTTALHMACLAANLQPGDEVITSPITFVASANCAVYCGAIPIFADIDPKTYNIDPKEIEKKLTSRTKAVIPVHFAGQSCDMETIHSIVKKAEKRFGTKIWIIEDASHALGSKYKGIQIGSCKFSDMTVMSFHPVKHITTGEGGAILTNDAEHYENLRLFSLHGITRDPKRLSADLGNWYYEQIELGYNARITDIQCALGVSQLKKLPLFASKRRQIVERYNNAFSELTHIQIPFEMEHSESNFHLYVLLFDFEKIRLERNQVIEELEKRQIFPQVHYIPVHTQPYYRKNFKTNWGDCLKAEAYYQNCLSLPLFPAMEDEEIEKVIHVVTEILNLKNI